MRRLRVDWTGNPWTSRILDAASGEDAGLCVEKIAIDIGTTPGASSVLLCDTDPGHTVAIDWSKPMSLEFEVEDVPPPSRPPATTSQVIDRLTE